MKINDVVFGVGFLILGIIIMIHVQGFPKIPGQQVGPAIFPGLVALGVAICGGLLMASGLRRRPREPWFVGAAWMQDRKCIVATTVVILGVVAYIALANLVGFLLLAPILLFIWFKALGVRNQMSVVVAIVATLVIWYAFYQLLRVPLPWGVLNRFAF